MTAPLQWASVVAIALATGAAITPLGHVQFWPVHDRLAAWPAAAQVAAAVLALAGRTRIPWWKITPSQPIAAYGSFWLGGEILLDVSGVLATLTAGIMMGNLRPIGRHLGEGDARPWCRSGLTARLVVNR